ncbi:MAG: anthranilate phosphoribosyltransferase [Candidatus Atribacteria bacterium]|nr:anthranilate phosphoribosyltransferase [bacterium]MCG2820587.1 anthranilate phosphoribosyltransferase [Candidatus Atribacteria bacterium]
MFKEILNKIVTGESLNEEEAYETMNEIMQGITTPAQIASFLTALRVKGETVEEITGCARAMRENAVSLKETYPLAVDTCGTGGDTKGTFNISTVAAFVVAGTGIMVAKHGNRGVSSKSGSADVLEALGININLTPSQVEECLQKLGIAFFFAPVFHPAMKHAIGPRREIGFRTIFNLLGPLTNPAGVKRQILGVYDPDITELIAGVLKRLGAQNAMVVCGEGGIDEISITGFTKITQIKNREITTYYIKPEDLGLCRYELKDIKGGDAKVNAEITLNILRGKDGPQRLMVIVNAAAALIVGGMAKDMRDGIEIAAETIDSGRALKKLEGLREYIKRLI